MRTVLEIHDDCPRISMDNRRVLAAAVIFLGTYLVLAVGRLPGFRVDRTGAAIIGAGLMIAFFCIGWPIAKVAIVAGALLLITRRVKPEKIYHEIDFSLLVLFAGLFIVIAGIEKTPFPSDAIALVSGYGLDRPAVLSAVAAVLSNLASNVPAVLLFKPLVPHLADPNRAWLILTMASTLAGNLTVLGSVANLIVIQKAKRYVSISFWEYLKVGVPLTIATLAVGVLFLR